MTITAKVIAKSRSPFHEKGVPDLTTFLLRYPRFIHSEVMTHRVFSRNASSSRAIPVKRLIQDVLDDTAMPLHWGKNQPGMQARESHDALIYHGAVSPLDMLENRFEGVSAETAWLRARDNAVAVAQAFAGAEYHKQIVNRILEPFVHINVVVTASNFDNFYWLRRHADAQPEIKALGDAMFLADIEAEPRLLKMGEWHLPFVTDADRDRVEMDNGGNGTALEVAVSEGDLLKVSTARCARTSYMTHDGRTPDFEEDRDLYHRLVGSEPLHASPAEHQAKADEPVWREHTVGWHAEHLRGNFDPGWVQHRKLMPREFCRDFAAWLQETPTT